MTQLQLVRCAACDRLIPVGYQLGLDADLHCHIPAHWQAHGWDVAMMKQGIAAYNFAQERRSKQWQRMRELLEPPSAQETLAAASATANEHEQRQRHMLHWLDEAGFLGFHLHEGEPA